MPQFSSPSTKASSRPGSGATTLLAKLTADWSGLSYRLVEDGLGAVTPDSLPPDHYDEVRTVIAECGHAVLGALAADRELTHDELRVFVEPAARRHLAEKLPLTVLIAAIHGSSQAVLDHAAQLAEPDESDQLVWLGSRLLHLMTALNLLVIETYSASLTDDRDALRDARRELCDALIHGRPAAGLAARADTVIADRYLVVSLLLDVDPDENPPNVVRHRRRGVLQVALDEAATDHTPARFDGVEGIALIAEGSAESDASDPRWSALAVSLTERLGVDVYLGFREGIGPGEIPAAAGEAAELTRLARGLRRGPGAYRIDDLLLEYQVTRPSPARDRLADFVRPLFESEHLMEALYAHLQHGPDRKAAAAQVHVHPNSYTYRLRRIAEITSLDPMHPRESRMLAAALMVAGRWEGPVPR